MGRGGGGQKREKEGKMYQSRAVIWSNLSMVHSMSQRHPCAGELRPLRNRGSRLARLDPVCCRPQEHDKLRLLLPGTAHKGRHAWCFSCWRAFARRPEALSPGVHAQRGLCCNPPTSCIESWLALKAGHPDLGINACSAPHTDGKHTGRVRAHRQNTRAPRLL